MNPAKKFRAACYTLEGINSFAVVIYFNYLYFYFRDQFGFDNKQNLALAAFIGLIYTFASWQAGKFAQRHGNFTALKIGFGVMAAGLVLGSQMHSVAGAITAACIVNTGMCFIWPVIEALISEGETPDHIPHAVGIYNMTWALTNAAAYFVGGAIIDKFGYQTIFYLPLGFMLLQLAMVFWIERLHVQHVASSARHVLSPAPHRSAPANAKTFQRMAWLANPFAYIAVNTLLAVMPGIAAQFHLSTSLAGFVCSLWCFARVFAFLGLWQWTRWHYRFRWLAGAFGLLILSFVAILSTPSLALLLVAQVFFGLAIGLIYYSSLFYSMDASDTKSADGGIHEAAIGLGNFIGPAVGAASLQFLPQYAHNGVMAVSVLLLGGFGGMVAIWKNGRQRRGEH